MADLPQDGPSDPFWSKLCASRSDCPEGGELWDYLERTLDETRAQQLAAHVAMCGHCAAELGRIYKSLKHRDEHAAASLADVLGRLKGTTAETIPVRALLWLQRHAALAAVCLLSVLLLGGCAVIVPDYYRQCQLRAAWREIASSPAVAVVAGDARVQIEGEERRGYIGVGDALAMSSVVSLLSTAFDPRPQVRVVSSREVEAGPETLKDVGAVIVIGGPVANPYCLSVLAALREVNPADVGALKRGFRFVGRAAIPRSAFVRGTASPDRGIEDVETGELCPYDRAKNLDCALIVLARLNGRLVLVIAGYEMAATRAAAEALTRWTPVLSELQAQFKKTGYAEMVVAVSGDGNATLYRFPTAQNPRGR